MNLKVSGFFAGVIMCAVTLTSGAVIFEDDFSNGANSNLAWTSSNEFITKEFKNGVCVVTNKSTENITGFVYKTMNTAPTLTVSSKIIRADQNTMTGFSLCFSTESFLGQTFLLGDKVVFIGGPNETLKGYNCPYLKPTENVLKISKNGTTYNVFVNDNFLTDYQSTKAPGTNFAFVSLKGTTATFDNFAATDQFIQGTKRTSFSDDFDAGISCDWTPYQRDGAYASDNGKLKLTTKNDTAYINMIAEVNLTVFNGKAEFTHKSGVNTKTYGFVLQGDGQEEQATFAITAGKRFGAVSGFVSYDLIQTQSVRGQAYTDEGTGQVTYYTDTLEIIKRTGSNEYIFVANRDTLKRLTGVNFTITKVGIFCQGNQEITVDNFYFSSPGSAVKMPYVKKPSSLHISNAYNKNMYIFDPLGRSVTPNFTKGKSVSSGLYLTRTQQKGKAMLIKGQK